MDANLGIIENANAYLEDIDKRLRQKKFGMNKGCCQQCGQYRPLSKVRLFFESKWICSVCWVHSKLKYLDN